MKFMAAAVYIHMDEQQVKDLKETFREIVYISQREELSVVYLADYAAPVDAAERIRDFFADRYKKRTTVGWSSSGWTLRKMGMAAGLFEKYRDAAFFMESSVSRLTCTAKSRNRVGQSAVIPTFPPLATAEPEKQKISCPLIISMTVSPEQWAVRR